MSKNRVSPASTPTAMGAQRDVGDGSFFVGVPAPALTAEEAERYREVIAGSLLYEAMDAPQGAPAVVAIGETSQSGEEG